MANAVIEGKTGESFDVESENEEQSIEEEATSIEQVVAEKMIIMKKKK